MIFSLIGQLKAFVFGSPNSPEVYRTLKIADVPVTTAECRSCADPCDEDHDDFPSGLDIDMDSDMLGSVYPYRRQVLISTGKRDWEIEVTEAKGTLAAFLETANSSLSTPKKPNDPLPSGLLFSHTEAKFLSILNGSHRPFSYDESEETVIVLPDFMVVSGVSRTLAGAEVLWKAALDPALDRAGVITRTDNLLNTWVLPYSCLILLCSHKRRDKTMFRYSTNLREDLELTPTKAFHLYLEREGWEVHTNLYDLTSEPSLESQASSTTEKERLVETQLKSLHAEHRALILMSSHFGGHQFAGNCVIYTPRGAGVWYGRVTPHNVESIVKHTIIDGQVIPTILRGGVDLPCRGKKTLYDW